MVKEITEQDITKIVSQIVDWKNTGRDKATLKLIEAQMRELANDTGLPFQFLRDKMNIRANRVRAGIENTPVYSEGN